MNQKEIEAYLKEVKKNCPYPFRKRLVAEMRGSVLDYLEENPEGTMEDVVAHFGAAETLGYSYILDMDGKERQKLFNRARWIKCCAIAGIVICLLLAVGSQIWIAYDNSRPLTYYQGG